MPKETSCATDSVISGYGNPIYRYEDMIVRRKLAALAGQHRTVQRLTKSIAVFRAAFGMPQLEDEPKSTHNHMVARQPGEDTGLAAVASTSSREDIVAAVAAIDAAVPADPVPCFDVRWMRAQTARGLAYVLEAAGSPALTRKTDGDVTTYSFDAAKGRVQLDVIDRAWCCAARVDGVERPLAEFASEGDVAARGVPPEMGSREWSGYVSPGDAQKYCVAWVKLAEELKK